MKTKFLQLQDLSPTFREAIEELKQSNISLAWMAKLNERTKKNDTQKKLTD